MLALGFLLVLAVPGWARAEEPGSTDVRAIDNVFSPRVVRVPIGGKVEWTNDGRTVHNVVADDGSFRSPTLQPADTPSPTFGAGGGSPPRSPRQRPRPRSTPPSPAASC